MDGCQLCRLCHHLWQVSRFGLDADINIDRDMLSDELVASRCCSQYAGVPRVATNSASFSMGGGREDLDESYQSWTL